MTKHLLVDLENTQPLASTLATWMGADGRAWIFFCRDQLKLLPPFEALGERVTVIPISRPGANSLDFHLVFYLGYLASRYPGSQFTVLSKDKGYDPAIAHARLLKFAVNRIRALGPAATKKGVAPVAKAKAPGSPAAASKAPAAAKKEASNKSPGTKEGVAKKAAAAAKAPAHAKTAPKSTRSFAVGVANPKVTGMQRLSSVPVIPPPAEPAAQALKVRKSAAKTVTNLSQAVLADLAGPNRPRTLAALERHIQCKIGPTAAPDTVQAVLEHLETVGAIGVDQRHLTYPPSAAEAVTTKQ